MWSIALKTLAADRGKLFTALVGVVFSIVLVNIQGGLFLGLISKAGLLVDHSDAEVWVGHRKMHNIDLPRDIPRRWGDRIRTIPGVERADPYLVGFADMTLPSGGFEGTTVVGVDPASMLGGAWNFVEGSPDDIRQTDGIIIDRREDRKLEDPQIGEVRELGGRRARIVAKTDGIMGFLVAPYVFTTYDRAAVYLRKSPDVCSYFLVKLEPGADPEKVCAAIRQRVPELDAWPREEYSRISADFWMTRTGLGLMFGAATLLGLFVGLVMVAQTLYALVLDRIAEFGTLKAIGATDGQIYLLLLVQGICMATAGSVIGLAVVSAVHHVVSTPQTPLSIPLWLSMSSCGMVLLICLVSSVLPYLRIRKVDPLMVLQG